MYLKCQRFSIAALDRYEDHLLFAAITETGQILPAETAQKIMQCPASDCMPTNVSTNQRIEQSLTSAQNDIIKMVNNRNLTFFEEEVSKLNHWADDLKFGLEQRPHDY